MKKHNKDVLKATLFALIAIFIMIGAAGLLFAEHKKKIQKEQQKKAAIESAIEDLGLDPKEHKEKIAELKQAAALAAKAAVKARDGDSEWVDAYLELQQTAVSMVKGEVQ